MADVVTWKLYVNEHTSKLDELHLVPPPDSLNSASRMIPGGVYTTFRTYDGNKILPLAGHIRRLEESAQLLGHTISLKTEEIQSALKRARQNYPAGDARIRVTLDLQERPGLIYISLEPLVTPSADQYTTGVAAATCPYQRENPRSKQTAFLTVSAALQRTLPVGVNECLMVDPKGRILEGLSSNFFAVKAGELWTAEEGVLSGITRALVLESARQEGVRVRSESILVEDMPNLQEAFITSSSRSVLPVRQIDDQLVGAGEPGPITRRLMQVFWENLRRKLVEL